MSRPSNNLSMSHLFVFRSTKRKKKLFLLDKKDHLTSNAFLWQKKTRIRMKVHFVHLKLSWKKNPKMYIHISLNLWIRILESQTLLFFPFKIALNQTTNIHFNISLDWKYQSFFESVLRKGINQVEILFSLIATTFVTRLLRKFRDPKKR